MVDYDFLNAKLNEISRVVGESIMRSYLKLVSENISYKNNQKDIVSEVDTATEKQVVQFLLSHFPHAQFIGEENYENSTDLKPNELTFIIDPVDGTSNYVYGIHYFALSIGVKYCDEFVGGVVIAPALGELFSSIKNCSSIYQFNQSGVSSTTSIEEFVKKGNYHATKYLIGTTYPCINKISGLLSRKISVRILGSIAITFCYAIIGKLDGFVSNCAKIWDIAGGLGIADSLGLRYFLRYNPIKDNYLIIFHREVKELEKLIRIFEE